MNNRLPWDITAADADGTKTAADADGTKTAADADGTKTVPATGTQIVRRLIVVILLTAAALDLTRCGLVMMAARHPAPAAASGFRGPYTIPDAATAALGMMLAITLLATAGRMGRDTTPQIPVCWTGEPRGDRERNRACPSPLHPTGTAARSWPVQ